MYGYVLLFIRHIAHCSGAGWEKREGIKEGLVGRHIHMVYGLLRIKRNNHQDVPRFFLFRIT